MSKLVLKVNSLIMQSSKYFVTLASKFDENCPFYASASLLNFRLKWPNDIYTENGIKIGGKELFTTI